MEDRSVSSDNKALEPDPALSNLGLDSTRPLIDELAAGHLGRFQMLGDSTTRAATLRRLRSPRTRSVPAKRQDGALLVLADTCGFEREAYVRNHSLLPFVCFTSRNARVQSSIGFWEQTVLSLVGLRSPRPCVIAQPHTGTGRINCRAFGSAFAIGAGWSHRTSRRRAFSDFTGSCPRSRNFRPSTGPSRQGPSSPWRKWSPGWFRARS